MKFNFPKTLVLAALIAMNASSQARAADFWDMVATKVDSKPIGTEVFQYVDNFGLMLGGINRY